MTKAPLKIFEECIYFDFSRFQGTHLIVNSNFILFYSILPNLTLQY